MKNMAGLLTEHDKHVLNRVQTSISMELFWSGFFILIWRSFVWYDDGYNNEPLFNFHHKTEPLWMKAMSFEGLSWNVLGWNKFVFLERSRCNHSHSWGVNFEFYHTLYLFIFSWFQKQPRINCGWYNGCGSITILICYCLPDIWKALSSWNLLNGFKSDNCSCGPY